jgi:NAD(P)-dependent dehydrogenase (short-subunit alcohol dehydrogenase family)
MSEPAVSTPGTLLDRFSLRGRVAVITGANRGLGRTLAGAFAEAGADIGLLARSADSLGPVAEEVTAHGRRVATAPCEVTSPARVQSAVVAIENELGPIDIWVNNAGITYWGPTLAAETWTGWQEIMDTNAGGVFHCSQAVGRRMAARGRGSIVNVGSISGLIVNRPQAQAAYNASKAAVHHLTRSMAVELAPSGVRVNALAPGYIHTEMTEHMFDDPAHRRYWIDDVPMRRAADPVEIAAAAVFLASDAASFMTGSILVVDGGYVLT